MGRVSLCYMPVVPLPPSGTTPPSQTTSPRRDEDTPREDPPHRTADIFTKPFWQSPEEWCFFHENTYTSSTFSSLGRASSTTAAAKTSAKTLDETISRTVDSASSIISSSKELVRVQPSDLRGMGQFVCCAANNAKGILCLGTARGSLVIYNCREGRMFMFLFVVEKMGNRDHFCEDAR